MKKLVAILSAAGFIAICGGCVQINSSDAGSMNLHPKTAGPVDDYRPTYEIGKERVTASSNVKCLFWFIVWSSDNAYADNAYATKNPLGKLFPFLNAKQTAAQAAFYKACKESNSDAIVAARYEITFEDYLFYKKMNVQIKGFPARVTGVEPIKPQAFYIDGTGKIITQDKLVKPVLLYDAYKKDTNHKKGFLTELTGFIFGE